VFVADNYSDLSQDCAYHFLSCMFLSDSAIQSALGVRLVGCCRKRGRFQAGASLQTTALTTTVSSIVENSASNIEGVVLQPQGIPLNGFSSAAVLSRNECVARSDALSKLKNKKGNRR
jgi:hypothetical protein